MEFSSYLPPVQRSLSDADLQEALGRVRSDYEGTLEAMAFLEEQAKLRAQDNSDFSVWVAKMQENGTPQALWALENAMRQRSGLETLPAPNFEQISLSLPDTSGLSIPEPTSYADGSVTQPQVVVSQQDVESPQVVASPEVVESPQVVNVEDVVTAPPLVVGPEQVPAPMPSSQVLAETITVDSEPKLNRRSRASSQFWAWLGLSGSILPLGLGVLVGQFEISFAQGVLAIALASLASASIISIGSLAGKRSGLGTVFLSRAAFGVGANAAPGLVLVLARFFWSAVLVWGVLALHRPLIAPHVNDSELDGVSLIAPLLVLSAAAFLAYFGGRVLFRAQKISGLFGLSVGLILVAAVVPKISWLQLLSEPNRSWLDTFASSTLILAVFGLAWSGTGSDFARKLSVDQLGVKVVGSAFLALAVIPTLFGAFGLVLARGLEESSPGFSVQFEQNFAGAIVGIVSPWISVILALSALVSLTVILSMSLYSTNLSLHAVGLRLEPKFAQPLLAVIVAALVLSATTLLPEGLAWQSVSDYAMFLAVPIAAWSGIFVSDVLIRRIAYHEISLSRTYGFYRGLNLVNLSGWFIATVIGLGLIDSQTVGIQWLGYFAPYLTNPNYWLHTNFGVLVALAIGILLPLATGMPRIRKQEEEVLAIEARRTELRDVLGIVD